MAAFLIVCGIGLILLVLSLLVGTLIYLTERIEDCERRTDRLYRVAKFDRRREEIDARFGPWGDAFDDE